MYIVTSPILRLTTSRGTLWHNCKIFVFAVRSEYVSELSISLALIKGGIPALLQNKGSNIYIYIKLVLLKRFSHNYRNKISALR